MNFLFDLFFSLSLDCTAIMSNHLFPVFICIYSRNKYDLSITNLTTLTPVCNKLVFDNPLFHD